MIPRTNIALAATALLAAAVVALSVGVVEPADGENSEWPTSSHDWARTGYTDENLPDNLELLWTFNVEGDYQFGSGASPYPAVANGKVYFAFGTSGGSGNAGTGEAIYAIDIENGGEVWRYEVETIKYPWIPSPTVAGGRVYVGSADNRLYVLDAENGDLVWYFDIPDEPNDIPSKQIEGAPAVVNGRVYFGSWNGYFYCLNAENGELVWKFYAGGHVVISPTVVGDAVYFGTAFGSTTVYSLNAENGDLIWSISTPDLGGGGEVISSLVFSDDKILMGGD